MEPITLERLGLKAYNYLRAEEKYHSSLIQEMTEETHPLVTPEIRKLVNEGRQTDFVNAKAKLKIAYDELMATFEAYKSQETDSALTELSRLSEELGLYDLEWDEATMGRHPERYDSEGKLLPEFQKSAPK